MSDLEFYERENYLPLRVPMLIIPLKLDKCRFTHRINLLLSELIWSAQCSKSIIGVESSFTYVVMSDKWCNDPPLKTRLVESLEDTTHFMLFRIGSSPR